MILTTPIWGKVCHNETNTSRANLCTKFDDSISAIPEKFKDVQKFWKGSRDTGHAPIRDDWSSKG